MQDEPAIQARLHAELLFRPLAICRSRPVGDVRFHTHRQIRPRPHRHAFHRAPAVVAVLPAARRIDVDAWTMNGTACLQIAERLFLNVDAVAGRHDLGDDLVIDQEHAEKLATAARNSQEPDRDHARSKKKSFQEFGLGFQRAASVHEVGKGLECRGRRAELQLVRRLRIHHLDHGFHAALLRLVLVVDFCRFFRVFRDELHGLVERVGDRCRKIRILRVEFLRREGDGGGIAAAQDVARIQHGLDAPCRPFDLRERQHRHVRLDLGLSRKHRRGCLPVRHRDTERLELLPLLPAIFLGRSHLQEQRPRRGLDVRHGDAVDG